MLDIGEPSSAQPGADQASHFGRSYGALGPIARRGNDILLTVVEAPFAELARLSRTSIAASCVGRMTDRPGRREAAFCHGVLSHCYGESPAKGIVGTTLCTLPIISRLAFCSRACFWREPRFCIKHHDQGGRKRRGDMGAGNPSHLIAYAHATDQGGREAAGRHYLKAMKSTPGQK